MGLAAPPVPGQHSRSQTDQVAGARRVRGGNREDAGYRNAQIKLGAARDRLGGNRGRWAAGVSYRSKSNSAERRPS